MKKHPVDDLFKRKLADFDKKPSSDAWLKIQESTKSRRKSVVWIWYAAASVSIALLAGYIVWQNNQNVLLKQIGDQKAVAAVKQKKMVEKPVETQTIKAIDPASEVVAQNTISEEKPSLEIKRTEISANVQKAEHKTIVEELQTAARVVEKGPTTFNSVAPINSSEPTELSITKPSVSESNLPENEVKKPEPAVTIVVAVETGNDQLEEKPKTSRFSRVFRQLKNARAGERVDWDEMGFNPKNLVARVDDRLRTREEKSSEKNQNTRERTKL